MCQLKPMKPLVIQKKESKTPLEIKARKVVEDTFNSLRKFNNGDLSMWPNHCEIGNIGHKEFWEGPVLEKGDNKSTEAYSLVITDGESNEASTEELEKALKELYNKMPSSSSEIGKFILFDSQVDFCVDGIIELTKEEILEQRFVW